MSSALILKPYDFEGQSIEVPFTNNAFFNATVAAKAFSKEPHAWLRSKEAQDYLEAFRKIHGTERKQLVITKRGGEPSEQGTWLDPRLGIPFARWLNPEFAVWADMQIEAILKGTTADTLIPSEQQTLSEIVHRKAESVPAELMGKALAEIWSRIHHKFRVSKYENLPRTQLSDVILYVTAMELRTGKKAIPKEEPTKALPAPDKYHYPASFWQDRPHERIGFLTWQDLVNAPSRPLPALLHRLSEDGNDIEGARIEYMAMRHIMELQHLILDNVARDVLTYPNRGLSVTIR
ncbi:hypothetical protein BN873_890006 [Candidatus Competibacter denitrificans Run_A_D11]|uniref:KilA-N domain-containing protein n=1 Tax=Candidatus Competibacter denitrificans Run_A_D11 TaxID=1400863 RepID=W6MCL0_9GAMM|nr:KilA-N domain-containing protein [Candidatus Competibacter denitrificans]CDI04100.1 hypothetical protein BN873_890006 [Candidatus Competibacter denitrificans Run_A_D11]